jgi:hypothetical protein
MSKYKFILTLPYEFEIDSEYEIDGHMAWPNYSQADPVRYRGIFDSYEEAKKYAEDFEVYKYILKYYYSHPYDSFEDEDECAKYFISIFDAEDAACAELGISPGDMVTPSEYKVEQIKRGNSKKGIPTGAYKYRLFDHGKCFLDSVKDNDEYFEDARDAEYAALAAARSNLIEIDELPYELVPIKIEKIEIIEVNE